MTDGGHRHPALAAMAARAASAGSPAVLFDVTHFGDGNGSHRPLPLTGVTPPSANGQLATETLAFHAAGVGFQLHTWAPETPNSEGLGALFTTLTKPAGGVSTSRITVRKRVDDPGAGGQLFHGSMAVNPGFLYDPAYSTEFLVTMRYDPWKPDYADSLMIARICHGMATAAAESAAPVLFLQCPVAPFRELSASARRDGSDEAPRIANGMALRMLVGVDNSDTGKRIALVRSITRVATEYGLGLQIADRRFGRVRGEWWSVLKPSKQKYDRRKAALFDWAPRGVPKSVRLLTFVGPARVGSSAAIAEDFIARNVGVLAVSETSLQEIAFVNVVVPVPPDRPAEPDTSCGCQPIGEGLGRVADQCGLSPPGASSVRIRIGGTPATDYQVLFTGPVTPRIEDPAGGGEHPLWLSWTVPTRSGTGKGPPDVAALVLDQVRAEPDLIVAGKIDYYRARVLPDKRVRGRAKITVSVAEGTGKRRIPTLLSELCPWAQRHVVAALVHDDVPFRLIRVRLAWRERWLGRASTVM